MGLYIAIPSEINIIDKYIIPAIELDINLSQVFYNEITLLISIIRFLIFIIPIYQIIDLYKYGKKYDIFR